MRPRATDAPPPRARGRTGSRAARWGGRVALALGGLGLGLLAAEATFRQRPLPSPVHDIEALRHGSDCFEPDLTLGYRARPGACGRDARGVRLSVHGEAPRAEGAPTLDLLLLGDSVAEVGTWHRDLADRLAASQGRQVALHNAGTAGYQSCQEAELYRRLRADAGLQPDLVLLQVCVNDLRPTPVLARGPGGSVRIHGPEGPRDLPGAVLRSQALTWLLLSRGLVLRSEGDRTGVEEEVGACMAEVGRLARSDEAQVLALIFPGFVDPGQRGYEPTHQEEERLEALAKAAGLPTLALREGLAAIGPVSDLATPEDILHPTTALANERITQVLAADLAGRLQAAP